MTKATVTKTDAPQDRLTRICDGMISAFGQHTEKREHDRAIVFIVDEIRGGIGLSGYADDEDALADLIIHLRAMLRAHGQDLHFIPIDTAPSKDRA